MEEGLKFEDYMLKFSVPAHPTRIGFTEDCHLDGQDLLYKLDDDVKIPLYHDLFDQDAIVLKNMDRCVTLCSDKGERAVKVTIPDYTHLGFWHMPHMEAPYVCIEPWSSLPSRSNGFTRPSPVFPSSDFDTSSERTSLLSCMLLSRS